MTITALLVQSLNGLASASSLFLAAAGLTLIFGVTRTVNFAHGSLYMLGAYSAGSLVELLGRTPLGFWGAVLLAALAVGLLGVLIEVLILRRLYGAQDLLQLLATFALVLIIKDAALAIWGAEDRPGPRAPGLDGAAMIAGRAVPEYDLFLIATGPLVLVVLWWLLKRTRWGILVRAAAEDREMTDALGVHQARLFTGVFAVGAFLAGLGGALNLPREPANLAMDLSMIADVFVVVVLGGMGSIPGAFLAAVLIGEVKALCIAIGDTQIFGMSFSFSKLTLVIEFVVMAVVLVLRPRGLLGRAEDGVRIARTHALVEDALRGPTRRLVIVGLLLLCGIALLPLAAEPYALVLLADIVIFSLFAVSLHFIVGPAGLHSFGHAAYFGLGAYGAAIAFKATASMAAALAAGVITAAAGALVFGWFCVRLSGIYLAMLTLAFAQIAWSLLYQWDAVTGGSNGMIGIWPPTWLASRAAYFYFCLAASVAVVLLLWRMLYSPFGYALRAGRDAPLRAEAIGIDVRRHEWAAFTLAGAAAGLAGALYAFAKGSISPEVAAIARSVDGLAMVLLGGVQTMAGPVLGAAAYTWLQDSLARTMPYWRSILGGLLLILVILLPQGLGGLLGGARSRGRA